MEYNRQERSKKAAAFYCSRAWRTIRPRIISVFDGIDIVAYYGAFGIDETITTPDEVHHIVELEDDWNERLDPYNLIPLAHNTHTRITALYKAGPASMAAAQETLRKLIHRHFADRGGVEKVFQAAELVAQPYGVERTPHEKTGKNTP